MIASALLTVAGVTLLWWLPRRARDGFTPRTTVALVLIAATSVWVGSLSLVAAALTGEHGGLLLACETLWMRLTSGVAASEEIAALIAWALLVPTRGLYRLVQFAGCTRRLRRDCLRQTAYIRGRTDKAMHLVDDLGTPAVTIGLLRPVTILDAAFWRETEPAQLDMVLLHERAHARGKHAWIDAATRSLTEPLAPTSFARRARHSVHRQLEALADDRVAHRFGAHRTGRVLGQVALGRPPASGHGVVGDSAWRVRRLFSHSWTAKAPLLRLVPLVAALTAGTLWVLNDTLGILLLASTRVCLWL